jgi:hypothetical protein
VRVEVGIGPHIGSILSRRRRGTLHILMVTTFHNVRWAIWKTRERCVILRSARGSIPYKGIRQLISMTNTPKDPIQRMLEAELGCWWEVGRRRVRRIASLIHMYDQHIKPKLQHKA